MEITETDPTHGVITLSGSVDQDDGLRLRRALMAALDGAGVDLLVDAREVTSFDDTALGALTAARTRAKWHRRGLVVLDAQGGPVETTLRRSGHLQRIPVYPDVSTARAALAQQHSVRARLTLIAGGDDVR